MSRPETEAPTKEPDAALPPAASQASSPQRPDILTPVLAGLAAASVLCFIMLAVRPQWLGLHRHRAGDQASGVPAEPPFDVQLAIAQRTVAALNLRDQGHIDDAIAALEATVAAYPQGGRYLAEPYLALGWCYRKKETSAISASNAIDVDACRQKALQYFDLTVQIAPITSQEAIDARAAAERIRSEVGPP